MVVFQYPTHPSSHSMARADALPRLYCGKEEGFSPEAASAAGLCRDNL